MAQKFLAQKRDKRSFSALILIVSLIAGLVSTFTPANAAVYTITYNLNGGEFVDGHDGDTTYDANRPGGAQLFVAGDEPQKADFEFVGWYTAEGVSITSGGPYSPERPYGNIVIYARWLAEANDDPTNLRVIYDSQLGSEISPVSTTPAGSISSPGIPIRDGYNFNGWFANSRGGSAITFPYTHARSTDFTLYAQWTAGPTINEITYNLNGGQFVDENGEPLADDGHDGFLEYTSGQAIVRTGQSPVKNGFVFRGWFTAAECGDPVSIDTYVVPAPYGPFVIHAQWTANQVTNTNTVTWDGQGATTASSGGSTTYTNGSSVSTIPTTAPQKIGYTFAGWFTCASSGSQITNDSFTPASPYGNQTFYAHWTENRSSSVGTWGWTNAAQVAAQAEAARKAKEQKELTEILGLIPSLGSIALNLGDLTNSLLKQKCTKGKKIKYVNKGAKCPKGFKRK